MANGKHCGQTQRVNSYRLESSKPAYEFQVLYVGRKCKVCGDRFMEWVGQYKTGSFSEFVPIPKTEHEHWDRRVQAGEAKPEPQLMSEYSYKAGRPADIAIYYHNTIELAQRFCKKA